MVAAQYSAAGYHVGTWATEAFLILIGLLAVRLVWFVYECTCRQRGRCAPTKEMCREAGRILSCISVLALLILLNRVAIDSHELYPPPNWNITNPGEVPFGDCGLALPKTDGLALPEDCGKDCWNLPAKPPSEYNLTTREVKQLKIYNKSTEDYDWFYVDLFPDDVDRWRDKVGPCGKTRVCEKGRELHMPPIQEEYDLKVKEECALIHYFDIVKQDWADKCDAWCQRELGDFIWNQPCAFGYAPGAKPMPLLVACQKAWVGRRVVVSDETCIMVGLLIGFLGHYLGVLRYVIMSDAEARTKFKQHVYNNTTVTEKLTLCGYFKVGITKITGSRLELVWLCTICFCNCVSDLICCGFFFSHGQPFFGVAIILSLYVGSWDDDIFGYEAGMYWCRSLRIGFPTVELMTRLAAGLNQSSLALVVYAMFFLNIKKEMEEKGTPFLSLTALLTMIFSLVFTLLGLFVGSQSMRRLEIMTLYEKLQGDFDRRMEKFADKSREFLYSFYTPAVFLQRASISGTFAFLMIAKKEHPKLVKVAIEYFLGMLIPALAIFPIILCCFRYAGSTSSKSFNQAKDNAYGLGVATFELSGSLLAVLVWFEKGEMMLGDLSVFEFKNEPNLEALLQYSVKKSILYITLLGVVLAPFNLVVVVVDLYRELFQPQGDYEGLEELFAGGEPA